MIFDAMGYFALMYEQEYTCTAWAALIFASAFNGEFLDSTLKWPLML